MKKLSLFVSLFFLIGCVAPGVDRVSGSKTSSNYEKKETFWNTYKVKSTEVIGEFTISSSGQLTSNLNKKVLFIQAKKMCLDAQIVDLKEGGGLIKNYKAKIICESIKKQSKQEQQELLQAKKAEKERIQNEKDEKIKIKKKEELDSMLAKQETCFQLGFETGTEKNGECVLKLMELEIQIAESNQTIINNNSSDTATVNALAKTQQQMLIQQQSQALINMGAALLNSGQPKINCRQTLTGFSCY